MSDELVAAAIGQAAEKIRKQIEISTKAIMTVLLHTSEFDWTTPPVEGSAPSSSDEAKILYDVVRKKE